MSEEAWRFQPCGGRLTRNFLSISQCRAITESRRLNGRVQGFSGSAPATAILRKATALQLGAIVEPTPAILTVEVTFREQRTRREILFSFPNEGDRRKQNCSGG